MTHLSEEELVLHYYGEADDSPSAERHLESCRECRAAYSSLERVLNVMGALPVPERGAGYGAQVWAKLAHELPARRRAWLPPFPWRWMAAGGALATLLVAAFLAGRFSTRPAPVAVSPQLQKLVLKAALEDYLDRSQIVLIELANANPKDALDISTEQERAANLLNENRLYRQTALHTGDAVAASVLDELERVLLEIAHSPARLAPAQLDDLRQRLRAEGILFRIRVLGSSVRSQDGHKL